MLLQKLPSKISQRVLRSVSWTEVDRALPRVARLGRVLSRVIHGVGSVVNLRAAVMRLRKGA
jgi:hypothetical protein